MIIKLLEQPIITVHEAEIAGTVDGVVIKGNKVSSIYHGNMESHFTIPIENAIIGRDAVVIQDLTAMALVSQNVKPLKSMLDVYNISGNHLGCLQGIEVDDEFTVLYMYTENYRIKIEKAVSYENVIVIDAEESELEASNPEYFFGCSREAETEGLKEEASGQKIMAEETEAVASETVEEAAVEDEALKEAAISMEIGPEINWEVADREPEAKDPVNSELSVVRNMHQSEEKADIPGVDAKYSYLCGKKLLEDIDIENMLYEKGTIINADLIKHAIGNNAIVKVIVSAEE